MDTYNRLKKAIEKYEQGIYAEHDFHSTLNNIIYSITEVELNTLRSFLKECEANLELFDFTVNKEEIRAKYLKIIENIKGFLTSFEKDHPLKPY